MKYKGYNAKRDANEPEIIAALEAIGCEVFRLDKPLDLLVGYRGKNWLIEVKTKKGRLTKDQKDFLPKWRGQLAVVSTPEQAISVVSGECKYTKTIFDSRYIEFLGCI